MIPKYILDKTGRRGETTGKTRPCSNGCSGLQAETVWPDKTTSWPCIRVLEAVDANTLRVPPLKKEGLFAALFSRKKKKRYPLARAGN